MDSENLVKIGIGGNWYNALMVECSDNYDCIEAIVVDNGPYKNITVVSTDWGLIW